MSYLPIEEFGNLIILGPSHPATRVMPHKRRSRPNIIHVSGSPDRRPRIGYCMNKTCMLNRAGGCCPGYGCRKGTGMPLGVGTCQRVSGGPR